VQRVKSKSDPKYKHQQHHAWYVWRSGNSTSAFALTGKSKTKKEMSSSFESMQRRSCDRVLFASTLLSAVANVLCDRC
jgi:hypothetical protein